PRVTPRAVSLVLLLGALLVFPGCATTSQRSIAPLDTATPGWTTRQGQAVWQPAGKDPEIAGDVVISSHPQSGAYVQFSKTLPILSATLAPAGWELHAIAQNKRYSGGGKPPRRIVWLQLLRALDGQELSERWLVAKPSEAYIALEDPHTGERLELTFQ
ncbi:MAG: hypothetical protein ACXW3Z_14265, partial [Limisphaerales bacterium]